MEEPVSEIYVKNCTIYDTDNGVRIKTWPALHGGSVSNIHFEHIVMQTVSNPIIIDQMYCAHNLCNRKPSKVKISDVSFKNIRGSSRTPTADQLTCSSSVPCKNVELSNVNLRGAQPNTFDVTKYGAKEGSDITKALLSAWKGACGAAGSGKVVIPKGKYSLGVVDLLGPCKGAMHLQVEGTLVAPAKASEHRKNSWVTLKYLDRLTVSGGGAFDGQGEIAWQQKSCGDGCKKALPVNLRFDFVTNSIVKDVTSIDSKQFHINLLGSKNLTFQRFLVKAPGHSPNTDGIHIGRSEQINIINSNIITDDDCISIGRGSRQVRITNVRCGHGHGISIGSLGKYEKEEPVYGIYVKNCKIYDTGNGVRIKTWPL
ncbi:polygalacturonase [Manihot esculenta]|uniref:polygalacturonase n=1 Tax=Manihot esculenta TaxID=3983 RepID=UPI001CC3D424|nr:polygalacturonase [Manihot esculenta]